MINTQNTYDLTQSRRSVQHNVLRNTYWLLALSMIPTVFGAFLGVSLYAIFSLIEGRITGWAHRKDEFAMG